MLLEIKRGLAKAAKFGIVLCLLLILAACNETSNSSTPSINGENLPKDRALFLSNRDGWPDLYTVDMSGKVVRRLTNSAEAEYGASWSPDGRHIAFTALNGDQAAGAYTQHSIYVIDADGTNRKLIAVDGYAPKWSPDGKKLLFTRSISNNNISNTQIPVATTTEQTASTPEPKPLATGQLKFSLYTVAMDTNNPVIQLLADDAIAGSWSPDAKRIAYISGNNVITQKRSLNLINSDGTGQISLSEQVKISNLDVLYVSWSPDGNQIAFSAIDTDKDKMSLYKVNPAGGAPRRLSDYTGSGHEATGLIWAYADFANPAPRINLGPSWSPNSQQLVYTTGSNQLVVINAETDSQHSFPVGGAALGQDIDSVLNVIWQPDNRHVLYERASVGRNTLLQKAEYYIYDFFDENLESFDTVNKNVQNLVSNSSSLSPACCGMDGLATSQNKPVTTITPSKAKTSGGKLVFTSGINLRQLILQNLQNDHRVILKSGNFRTLDFSLSPAGDYLVWLETDENYKSTMYLSTIEGKDLRQLTTGNGTPDDLTKAVVWSPDGKAFSFKALTGDKNLDPGLYIYNVGNGDKQPRFVTKDPDVSAFTWSPDSKQLAYKVDRVSYKVFVVPADNPPPYPNPVADIGIFNSRYGSEERGLAWSPDGKYLAFAGVAEGGRFAVWLYNKQGEIYLVPGSTLPINRILGWTTDSNRLLFSIPTSTQSGLVEALDLSRGKPVWRSYDEGIGAVASSDSANLLFYTQHNLTNNYDFYNSNQTYTLDEPYISLVSFSNGQHLNDFKLKFPPYFGFKGRFFCWAPDGQTLAYYENNTIYTAGANGKDLLVLTRAFAVDRLAWVK